MGRHRFNPSRTDFFNFLFKLDGPSFRPFFLSNFLAWNIKGLHKQKRQTRPSLWGKSERLLSELFLRDDGHVWI